MKKPTTGVPLAFHWGYILLPIVTLILSVILAAFFLRLPAEIAYSFQPGSADRWLSRGEAILWTLLPQLFFTLLAGALTWGITRLGSYLGRPDGARVKPEKILPLMGNMVVLPQIILVFAMLDIFSYNAYQIHLLPLWVFALIVMGGGSIILGIFFIRAIRNVLIASKE